MAASWAFDWRFLVKLALFVNRHWLEGSQQCADVIWRHPCQKRFAVHALEQVRQRHVIVRARLPVRRHESRQVLGIRVILDHHVRELDAHFRKQLEPQVTAPKNVFELRATFPGIDAERIKIIVRQ